MGRRLTLLGLALATPILVLTAFIGLSVHAKPRIVDVRDTLTLEVASSESARELGLGYRDSLAPHHGMLFTFEKSGIYPFWMKGMRFPLDIIWMSRGIVKDVTRLDPPKTDTETPAWHVPTSMADRVLEINAGEAAELGIKPGVQLLLSE